MKTLPRLVIVTLIVLMLQSVTNKVFGQTPLLEYNFNQIVGGGTTAPSTGSSASDLTLYNSSGVATNLHGADGSGVSGLTGDLAFDNSASSGMGSAGTGGRAQTAATVASVNTLKSFTLTGWFKTADATSISGNAALINNQSGASDGFRVYSSGSGVLALNVNGSGVTSTSTTAYAATQSWVFFAVTYDGTSSLNNVKFYVGSTSSATQLNVTRTLDQGTTNNNTSGLSVGNLSGANVRAFDGLLDDINIYGSQADSFGVLSLSQIEAIRLSSIPEPTVLGLTMAASVVMLAARRRSRLAT